MPRRKQDWTPRTTDYRVPKAGDRVISLDEIDRYPHFILPKGTTGVLIRYDLENRDIRVRMDKKFPGAEEWNNELRYMEGEVMDGEFEEDWTPKT